MKKVLLMALIASLMGPLMLDAQDNESTAKEDAFFEAVKSIMDKYSASLLAGDVDSWISLWDDNAVKMPANHTMIVGIENIKRNLVDTLRIEKFEVFDIQIKETHVDNTFGYVFGNYNYSYVLGSSEFKIDRFGKYVTVLKKQDDGSWKIVLDCSNLNH